MKKLWKWLFGTKKQQCNIHDVSGSVCCENCKHETPISPTTKHITIKNYSKLARKSKYICNYYYFALLF